MLDTIELVEPYYTAKTQHPYSVIKYGYDYTTIRCRGKPLNVPKRFVYKSIKTYEELPTYEDIIEAEES